MRRARPLPAWLGLVLVLGGCRPDDSSARPPPDAEAHVGGDRVAAPGTTGLPELRAPSSAVLALLPDGEQKRKFTQDCTGCHQLDVELVFPGGEPRDSADWVAVIQLMKQMGGAATETPLVSPARDPERTAGWLAGRLRSPPARAANPEMPPGAEIESFPFPFPADLPHDLAVDREGGVLVTGMFTHQMLRLDPATSAWDTVPIPVEQANPRAVEVGPEGDWWVLLGAPGRIARYQPAREQWDSWDIGMYGHSLRLDAAGRVWFNGHFTRHPSIFGSLDPASGELDLVELADEPPPEAEHPMPYGLRVDGEGHVWGTELRGGRLFDYDPAAGTARIYRMPAEHSAPRRLAIAPDGGVWIPEYATNHLTRFDPETETFDRHELPIPDALPYVAEVARSTGTVWLGTAAADAVLSFDPGSQRFTVYPTPTAGALIRHLVVDDTRGEVWAVYGAFPGVEPLILRIRPAPRNDGTPPS